MVCVWEYNQIINLSSLLTRRNLYYSKILRAKKFDVISSAEAKTRFWWKQITFVIYFSIHFVYFSPWRKSRLNNNAIFHTINLYYCTINLYDTIAVFWTIFIYRENSHDYTINISQALIHVCHTIQFLKTSAVRFYYLQNGVRVRFFATRRKRLRAIPFEIKTDTWPLYMRFSTP